MKTISKLMLLALILLSITFLNSCRTLITKPIQDTAAFPSDSSTYTILGRVELTVPSEKTGFFIDEDDVGYQALYKEAKSRYPECDDIVNIKTDIIRKYIWILCFPIPLVADSQMSGIAIKYNN